MVPYYGLAELILISEKYNGLLEENIIDLPNYQFDSSSYWINKSNKLKTNDLNNMFYVREWGRDSFWTQEVATNKHKNILVLVNDQDNIQKINTLISDLSKTADPVLCVFHDRHDFIIGKESRFEFYNRDNFKYLFDYFIKNHYEIDAIIYFSSTIDFNCPERDLFALKYLYEIFQVSKIVTISFDNFKVIGNEILAEFPSIIYGVAKSLKYEYSDCKLMTNHFDLSLNDINSIKLIDLVNYSPKENLVAFRNQYSWYIKHEQVTLNKNDFYQHGYADNSVFLITGGLGGIGYSYIDYISSILNNCTFIIVGRSHENQLREDYQNRLEKIRKTSHQVIYQSTDFGIEISDDFIHSLTKLKVEKIHYILHASGKASKSIISDKSEHDISEVVRPKIIGFKNILKIADKFNVDLLINCSSISSVIPSIGNLEYTAANLFLDEISYRNYSAINKIVTININQVSDVGMAVDFIKSSNSEIVKSLNSIQSTNFPGITNQILANISEGNIVVSKYSISELLDKILQGSSNDKLKTLRQDGVIVLEKNSSELQYKIAYLFSKILGNNEISIKDDFFSLGGSSILAIQLAYQINKTIGMHIRVGDIFKLKTVEQLANFVANYQRQIIIPKCKVNKPFLSFAQERLWFIEQYEEGTNAYHMPFAYELESSIEVEALKKGLHRIVTRHEVLRTVFKQDEAGLDYQQVEEGLRFIVEEHITEGLLPKKLKEAVNTLFDLTKEYPLKVWIYTLKGSTRKILVLSIHHIAFDGWSLDIFMKELKQYYLHEAEGAQITLAPLTIQYKDFAVWQRTHLSGKRLEQQVSYWENKLSGYEPLALSTDYVRPAFFDYRGKDYFFEISEEISQKLRKLAQSKGVTLYTVLLSGFYLLLSKYTGQEDLVIGTPIANRHYEQLESLIGFFVNSLAIRVLLQSDDTVEHLIEQVHQDLVDAQVHQDLPFEKLVEALKIEPDPSRHPLFQVMFVVQSFGQSEAMKSLLNPLAMNEYYQTAKFDISLFINDNQGTLRGNINYATSLYQSETIERLAVHYQYLLGQIADDVSRTLSEYFLLSPLEYQQIVYDWNATDKAYPHEKTIHQMFEEQVARTPEHSAVVFEGAHLTYRELNEQSNQLARYLRLVYQEQGREFKPGSLCVLCLDRSLEMLVGILGILKAGGAYVPIDPNYPADRIRYLLEDTGSQLLLTQTHLTPSLGHLLGENTQVITLDDKPYQHQDKANLPQYCKSSDLAYVIYTSGTTGLPKGVMIEHTSFVATIKSIQDIYFIDKQEITTYGLTNYVFDIFGLEYGIPLTTGGVITIGNPNFGVLDCSQYDFIQMTPSLCDVKINSLRNIKNKILFVGGENLSRSLLSNLLDKSIKVINVYGPTETTIWSASQLYEGQDDSISQVHFGKPFANEKMYILDKNHQILPVGAVGELYIGGIGLARGYLNRPELTLDKFIANPFQNKEERSEAKNTRLYKTGDLVKWLSDGVLEYIKRNDFQVKIRGHRIEPGEIERTLDRFGGIKQNIVQVREYFDKAGKPNGSKYLVAYYIKDLDTQNDKDYVKAWENLYQYQYSSLDINNFQENTSLWISSYTDEEIKKEDMLEWVKETTDRIKLLKPQQVLDIGSGSGLIMFNIIEHCKFYWATDLSEKAINYTDHVIHKFSYDNKVSSICCSADKIPFDELEKKYDTVILNSVIQYFPNIHYLESLILKAISHINEFGKIFIGDVRDYRLLHCFHYSVQKFKKNHLSKANIDYFAKRDKELLVSPEYFINLKEIYKNISYVEVLPKFGRANHEMNNYRYDVILYINNIIQEDVTHIDEESFIEVSNLEKHIEENQIDEYQYIKYPNKRILEDYIEYRKNYHNISIEQDNYKNILGIHEIQKNLGNKKYKIKFLLDLNDPAYFNIIFYKDNLNQNFYVNYKPRNKDLHFNYSNNPLFASKLLENQFSQKIKTYLTSHLPDYMVPDFYVALDRFPLTINGKLDRKALPAPDFLSEEVSYIGPRNELESELCTIWQSALGLEKVGIKDDFFRLGGHSILAIQVSHQMSQLIGRLIAVSDIFKYKTIAGLKRVIVNPEQQIIIRPLEKKTAPLSFAQERLWFIEQYEEGTNAYHMPFAYELESSIEVEALKKGLHRIVTRHEVLRTVFKQDEAGLDYQQVEEGLRFIVEEHITEGLLPKKLKEAVNTLFDLTKEYPLKVWIYTLKGSTRKILVLSIHHIAFDGWSLDIFMKELKQYYLHEAEGAQITLAPLTIQYKDFAVWQRTHLSGKRLEQQVSYWENKLSGYEPLALSTDYVRPAFFDYRGKDYFFEISEEISQKLRKLAQSKGVTLYTVLLSGFYLLLSKYTGQEDLVIGTPIANRHYEQLESLIGFFVNSLAIRVLLQSDDTVEHLIEQVHQDLVDAQVHQDLPFEKLVEALKIEPDPSRHPLFQVMFVVQSFGQSEAMKSLLNPLAMNEYYQTAKFDISLFINDNQGTLRGNINYATSLYQSETIERLAVHYQYLLGQIADDVSRTLSEYFLLSPLEYQQIVYDWNATDKAYPHEKTIHQMFEEQVARTPEHSAVVFEGAHLTYRELNEQSNQLARYLRLVYQEQGREFKPGSLCVLCLDRSLEMLVGILGILKAGGAYVPIDPNYPADRIRYLLEDTGSQLLLTQTHLTPSLGRLLGENTQVITLDDKPYQHQDKANLPQHCQSGDLVYVIYTSGTTGLPKGVAVEHKSLVNLISLQRQRLGIDSTSIILQYALLVFDASVWEIFSAIALGGQLSIISDRDRKDPRCIINHLMNKKITIATIPPALLTHLEYQELPDLKVLEIGGESCDLNVMKRWEQGRRLINAYGPTESTVCATMLEYQEGNLNTNIGKPLANLKVYVLGKDHTPTPIGAIGELYISGSGLAREYLNQPELTAERFIPNPYATESDNVKGYTRLYKTGDQVRWLTNGDLEYVGRIDFQVKIRGYRIELGEIEQVLSSHALIKQSVVLVNETQTDQGINKYLVAYYLGDEVLTDDELRNYLVERLPEYMIPGAFVFMEYFPLTPNGKLDKKAFPEVGVRDNGIEYIAPRSALETQMSSIWEAVLGVEKLSIKDDFFRLGGDSILSIQLISRLRHQGIICGVKDLFEQRTIERLAHYLSNHLQRAEIEAEQGALEGRFGLLPIQSWFFDQGFSRVNHWNQSFMIRVPSLSLKKLEQLLPTLVMQHDILRVNYVRHAEGFMEQSYHAQPTPFKINTLDVSELSSKDIAQTLTAWQSQFDIEKGPLWQMGYIHGYEDGSARLYFALHHLIVDAVSWRILIGDLKRLYDGFDLGEKSSSYRQWVNLVQAYALAHQEEVQYWQAQIEEQPDYNAYLEVTNKPHHEHFTLDKKITLQLIGRASQAYHTEINDLLLTALAYALRACLGISNLVIALEGHGREHLNEFIEVSRTVGWFTTLYPVKLGVKNTLSESIKSIKENLRRVPNKGIGYGALKYGNNALLGLSKLPPICFNYLGQFDEHESSGWQFINECTGTSMHSENAEQNLITLNSLIVNGELAVNISTRLNSQVSQQFSHVYKSTLIEIINHCIHKIDTTQLTYTPSDFNSVSISQDLLDALQARYEIEAIFPANSLQQGFIYHVLSQPEDDAYRVQTLIDYHNKMDIACYEQAWALAIQTYPALRTCFNWDEELVQLTMKTGVLRFTVYDIVEDEDKDNTIKLIQEQDRAKAFDLSQPTLFRLYFIRRDEEHFTLLQNMHHSIIDGWSGPVLLNTVHRYYYQLIQGKSPGIKEDSAYFQAQAYTAKNQLKVMEYWKKTINQIEQVNDLNAVLNRSTDLDAIKALSAPSELSLQIAGEEYQSLKGLVKEEGLTCNVLVQFAWHKLIQVYTRDVQTIVGTTVSGRSLPVSGVEDSVGLYINTLPLLVDWAEVRSVRQQLQNIHQQITDLNNHSYVNLASLQQNGKRLFHSLLIFENYPLPKEEENEGRLRLSLRAAIEKLDYPLALLAYETDNALHMTLKYEGRFLDERKASQLLEQLQLIIEQLPIKISEPQHTISLLTAESYRQIMYDWNATDKDYPQEKTIHQMFEEQVLRTPNHIAVVFEGKQLTYQELNEQSNQLARYIRQQYLEVLCEQNQASSSELRGDTFIALCLDRSIEMIIAILGVLKAGGAYVPIDPDYPDDRIRYMLEDTNSVLVLTQNRLVARLQDVVENTANQNNELKSKLILLDDKPYESQDKVNLQKYSQSTDLAYVIYTSGTTGLPKGVVLQHSGIINRIEWMQSQYPLNNEDIILHKTPYTFDVSVWELLWANWYGARIVISKPEGHKDSSYLSKLIKEQNITCLHFVPSMLSVFIEDIKFSNDKVPPTLRFLFCSGEVLSSDQVKATKALSANHLKIHNLYGPTEASIDVTYYDCNGNIEEISIGRPIQNTRIYVLDNYNKPVPIGVIGELHIGGAGLARGYLNKPNLTLEQFIPNSFATESDKVKEYTRLYKTGDLVRWLPNGNLEYVDRNDFQVKIRGYRIELGELEHALFNYDAISQNVVIVRGKQTEEGFTPNLVAYYISDEVINEDKLKEYLSERLPSFMIPSAFVHMDSFPINTNGKLDRKALPEPDFKDFHVSYIAPETEIEMQMCSIWQSALGVEKVGIEDDFFRLGGNSITAIQIVSKMNNILKIKMAISDIFSCRNISNLKKELINNANQFSLIKQLNNKNNLLPLIYFIHPGAGGCEIYQPLTDLLEPYYQAIGIDNFNIHNNEKIESLSEIAGYYLDEIWKTFPVSNEINLCGWSLGGQIALEIAYKLEQRGFKKIKVYLLDTVLNDEHLKHLKAKLNRNDILKNLRKQMIAQNLEESYIEKVCSAHNAELSMSNDKISGTLFYTEILLLKAVKMSDILDNDYLKVEKYICSIPDNNVQSVASKPIRIGRLDCNHNNIFKKTKEIIKFLVDIDELPIQEELTELDELIV